MIIVEGEARTLRSCDLVYIITHVHICSKIIGCMHVTA